MFHAKIVLLCTACVLVMGKPQGFGGFGSPQKLEGQQLIDAQQELHSSLVKLDAGDGPHYRIVKVLEATSQVVAGISYKFTVELIDESDVKKVCKVDIWNRSWLPNGIEVTFKCPNEPELTKKHSA
ncbi:uncharacterized protein Dana_GF15461 [Drosophila ananassae]|uniref:Cystatin domain-containing protein n=1 Tax=Drosophila ananassae TaxID=7217 RepID=B3ML34_DROAN|nr:sarcocystatin-A [Drosophila ananassae]EDV31652.1 uncharacterized protein Dana_GF15461 [Drosophila ananassae]